MKKIIVFGAGDVAQLAHFTFQKNSVEIAAFVVDESFKTADRFCDLPVVKTSELSRFPPNQFGAFVAVGYSAMNRNRTQKYLYMKKQGYKMVNCISPQALCLGDKIGENCFIFEGVVIQPFVSLGNNVTLWSGVHVGHHSQVGDHCFLAPRAALAGRVTVGDSCFIGVNATVKDHVTLGPKTLVAAGALVVENTKAESFYKGVKATAVAKGSSDVEI